MLRRPEVINANGRIVIDDKHPIQPLIGHVGIGEIDHHLRTVRRCRGCSCSDFSKFPRRP